MTDAIGNLAKALAAAQAEFGAVKKDHTAKLGTYSYKYATLDSVLDAIKGPLGKQGLALVQRVSTEANKVSVSTELIHVSGERLDLGTVVLLAADQKPQSLGSAITYARRYGAAAVGVAPEDDDDAQEAQRPAQRPQQGVARRAAAAGQVSEPQSPALSGDSPAPALPAPAFKDVLGAKLAESRGKPQLAVVKTHDEDGFAVHPEDREDEPLPAFDPKTGEIIERDPELPAEQVQTQEQLVTEAMGMLKTAAQKRSKKGDKLSALVSELTVKIWGFEVTPDLLRETLTAIERHRLVDGLLALEQEVRS